ncbi:MAG TPA: HD domain-containing phosphohydrolase [Pirellulales bacterium]|nr:HD domain-containing phosphohydrolase [Pirellulales bacterium]
MHGLVKYFAIAVAVQVGCVAAGLWVHDCCLLAAIQRSVTPELTMELDAALPLAGTIALVWICGLLSVGTYLVAKRFHDRLRSELERSQERGFVREQALVRTRDAVIFGLAKLAESRDQETGAHVERMSLYSQRLAAASRPHPDFCGTITPAFVRLIGTSAVLHDIGKVGIDDVVLHKPGPLTASERAAMQQHARIGAECLREIEQRLGACNFLQMAREIATSHHERWDGTGYPSGLAGNEIPLSARIVAIADNYDALVSRRSYKEAFSHERAVDIIRQGSGTMFDPRLVRTFLEIEPQFRDIARQFAVDPQPEDVDTSPDGRRSERKPEEPELVLAMAHSHEKDT